MCLAQFVMPEYPATNGYLGFYTQNAKRQKLTEVPKNLYEMKRFIIFYKTCQFEKFKKTIHEGHLIKKGSKLVRRPKLSE